MACKSENEDFRVVSCGVYMFLHAAHRCIDLLFLHAAHSCIDLLFLHAAQLYRFAVPARCTQVCRFAVPARFNLPYVLRQHVHVFTNVSTYYLVFCFLETVSILHRLPIT